MTNDPKMYCHDELMSEFSSDISRLRPGGRVLNIYGDIFRLSQNRETNYGTDVNAFNIIELNIDNYYEEKAINNPIVKQGNSNREFFRNASCRCTFNKW